ncbi:hypothetical protein IV203_019627 [Nitzschia inconspicua]|uniref:DNA helicase n=1 Tax=Nitzschia inconspicua TaxID=303405 RepID=A0A9K3LZH3_9STRA|nr:hypothetical protein IV203_019627 [Nitzschia inconspicua]
MYARNRFQKYADRVMCTRLHGFNPRSVPKACSNDCTSIGEGIEGYLKCTRQDLKQLQTKHGERMEVGDRDNDEDNSSIGIRGMIGAAFMATKAYNVAAPMASYLVRNGPRFQFSHDFSYVNIRSLFEEVHEDLEISADEEGYKEAERTEKESSQPQYTDGHHISPAKRRRLDDIREKIGKVIDNEQLIGFLCGAGGTGKSHVIKTLCRYPQKLCEELLVKFEKRSIFVTALTGAAAVLIMWKQQPKLLPSNEK